MAGLHVVAHPDPEITADLNPFEAVGLGEEYIRHLFVGVEAGFVNEEDFMQWRKKVLTWLSKAYKIHGPQFTKFDPDLLHWAVGMLWPDQSYVSLRKFRGRQSAGWSDFHEARFNMLLGEFFFTFHKFIISGVIILFYFLLFYFITVFSYISGDISSISCPPKKLEVYIIEKYCQQFKF